MRLLEWPTNMDHEAKLIDKNTRLPVIQFRLGLLFTALLFSGSLVFTLLISDQDQLMLISNIYLLIESLFAIAVFYYTSRYAALHSRELSRSWTFFTLALLSMFVGNVIWALIVFITGKSPPPLFDGLFSVFFYMFTWFGLYLFPFGKQRGSEYKYILLDNIIVILGSGLFYWVFLFDPLINKYGSDFSQLSVSIIFPTLDLILLWSLLTFFRNRPEQSCYAPLLLFALALLTVFAADSLFIYQDVIGTYKGRNIIDIIWSISMMISMLAGFAQISLLNRPLDPARAAKTGQSAYQTWPVYLPYFWLLLASLILFFRGDSPAREPFDYFLIGTIFILVVFRQVLTLKDNEYLIVRAHNELDERIKAQEALAQASNRQEERVQERTAELVSVNARIALMNEDLTRTNQALRKEMAERTQAQAELRASLQDKEVLLKEIHHRVKNNLQIISSLFNLQARKVKDATTLEVLHESQNRVRSMALIHEKLYHSDNLAQVDFSEYVRSLANSLLQSYKSSRTTIELHFELDPISLPIETATPCGLIFNELVTNALKYAFPNEKKGNLWIEARQTSSNCFTLRIADDGIGLPPDLDPNITGTLGLQLVTNLVNQLSGTLEVENKNGVSYRISFQI